MITALFYFSGCVAGFIAVRLLVNYQEQGIWSISIKNPNHHNDEE